MDEVANKVLSPEGERIATLELDLRRMTEQKTYLDVRGLCALVPGDSTFAHTFCHS